MIKSKPAALPLYYVSTHSLMAVVVLTVEVTLPATPPAVSSGKSATLRLKFCDGNDRGPATTITKVLSFGFYATSRL